MFAFTEKYSYLCRQATKLSIPMADQQKHLEDKDFLRQDNNYRTLKAFQKRNAYMMWHITSHIISSQKAIEL